MAHKLGYQCKLMYKAGGHAAGGSYVELSNVRDVTLELTAAEADVTTRANNGWRATVSTLKEGTVTFSMVWDPADTGQDAIRTAFLGNSLIAFQVLDGASGEGLQADFNIMSFSRNEALAEAAMVDVTAKIAYSATAPSWLAGS
jgi:hypothetical protein